MKLWNNKWFTLSIHKKNRHEPFHWKALPVPHRKSMAEVTWTKDEQCTDLYFAQHYFVTHFLQIFWLWFIIALELKEEKLSGSKYVRYESTHYAMIDEQLQKKP